MRGSSLHMLNIFFYFFIFMEKIYLRKLDYIYFAYKKKIVSFTCTVYTLNLFYKMVGKKQHFTTKGNIWLFGRCIYVLQINNLNSLICPEITFLVFFFKKYFLNWIHTTVRLGAECKKMHSTFLNTCSNFFWLIECL